VTHALLRPRIALPFLTISLIWGSTWFVITGQIDGVPPAWSVAWRFVLATLGMFALAMATGNSLKMPKPPHLLALAQQLADGSSEAYAGSQDLSDGIGQIYAGQGDLTKGLLKIHDGQSDLTIGLKKIHKGQGDLTGGIKQIHQGQEDLTAAHVLSSLGETVPLARMMDEHISQLRTWADGRARNASVPRLVPADKESRTAQ
jgi:X-X-X-Leu-X-X-Gly heptad repeat protein